MRQAPIGSSFRWSQKYGTAAPLSRQAWSSEAPLGTSTSPPSMVIVTICRSGTGVHQRRGIALAPADGRVHLLVAVRAGVGIDVSAEVFRELLNRGTNGPGGSFAKSA